MRLEHPGPEGLQDEQCVMLARPQGSLQVAETLPGGGTHGRVWEFVPQWHPFLLTLLSSLILLSNPAWEVVTTEGTGASGRRQTAPQGPWHPSCLGQTSLSPGEDHGPCDQSRPPFPFPCLCSASMPPPPSLPQRPGKMSQEAGGRGPDRRQPCGCKNSGLLNPQERPSPSKPANTTSQQDVGSRQVLFL